VYKNPEYIFLDEATNALDSNNEKEIIEHLLRFYKGKTVVVVLLSGSVFFAKANIQLWEMSNPAEHVGDC
jgi:ATP-binding cassette subfamily B protein